MVRLMAAAIALSLSMGAWAVDGYKDLKFNMSKAEVKQAKICSFKEAEPESWQCSDMKFGVYGLE